MKGKEPLQARLVKEFGPGENDQPITPAEAQHPASTVRVPPGTCILDHRAGRKVKIL